MKSLGNLFIGRLTLVLIMTVAALLPGSKTSVAAENKSIIIGDESYDSFTANVDFQIEEYGKPDESGRLIFGHTKTAGKNFIIEFFGCVPKTISNNCGRLRNTQIILKNSLFKGVYNIELISPYEERINLNAKYNGNTLILFAKLRFNSEPLLGPYDFMEANIDLNNLTANVRVKEKNGKNSVGLFYVKNDKIHRIIDGHKDFIDLRNTPNYDAEMVEYLFKTTKFYVDYMFKDIKSIFDFSGLNVHKGKIFKDELRSSFNEITSVWFEGFKVIGEKMYRGREVLAIKPLFNNDIYREMLERNTFPKMFITFLETLTKQGISLSFDSSEMYVDKSSGVPVFFNYSHKTSINNQKVYRFKLELNTEFPGVSLIK